MSNQSKIFRLEGVVQHYNWGGKRFLPEILRQKNTEEKPFAEYWMGAHVNAPSLVVDDAGNKQPLDQFINENGKEVLGNVVSESFGRLPYLFKVLDVHDMLSIQVHPSKQAAVVEFDTEEKKGIALNAPDRNYKDDNHKPELMIALSEFWLLHGFKEPAAFEKILHEVPELNFLIDTWKKTSYEGVYKKVMEMSQEEVNNILQPLIARVLPLYEENRLNKSQEDFWAARAYKTFCTDSVIDRGLFSVYFFNVVNLHPGEAIFQDAGILHAYLEGQNLELMANSDNVLRGGLTNKHVDVSELMKHVRFEPTIPNIIHGIDNAAGEKVFQTPAADFELREINAGSNDIIQLNIKTTEIFFVAEGNAEAKSDNLVIERGRGEVLLATAGASLRFTGKPAARIFHATVPYSQS